MAHHRRMPLGVRMVLRSQHTWGSDNERKPWNLTNARLSSLSIGRSAFGGAWGGGGLGRRRSDGFMYLTSRPGEEMALLGVVSRLASASAIRTALESAEATCDETRIHKVCPISMAEEHAALSFAAV